MTTDQFCHWLRGFSEAAGQPNNVQWQTIIENLDSALQKTEEDRPQEKHSLDINELMATSPVYINPYRPKKY